MMMEVRYDSILFLSIVTLLVNRIIAQQQQNVDVDLKINPSLPPNPGFMACSICGVGMEVSKPNENIKFSGQPEVSCSDLQDAAMDGFFEPNVCSSLQAQVSIPCGCEITSNAGFSKCSVCGEGYEISLPNAAVEFSGQPKISCAALQWAGNDGHIDPAICFNLITAVQQTCGCVQVSSSASSVAASKESFLQQSLSQQSLEPTTLQPTTPEPTLQPTSRPTLQPTSRPTLQPTSRPTSEPTLRPTSQPTSQPTTAPPTFRPTSQPTLQPTTLEPSLQPSPTPPSLKPSLKPFLRPSLKPSTIAQPTLIPIISKLSGKREKDSGKHDTENGIHDTENGIHDTENGKHDKVGVTGKRGENTLSVKKTGSTAPIALSKKGPPSVKSPATKSPVVMPNNKKSVASLSQGIQQQQQQHDLEMAGKKNNNP